MIIKVAAKCGKEKKREYGGRSTSVFLFEKGEGRLKSRQSHEKSSRDRELSKENRVVLFKKS